MLGLVGVIFAEQSTGISWVDAGKVLNEQPSYLGFDINVPLKTLVLIEVLAMGFAEVKRSGGASPKPRSVHDTLGGRPRLSFVFPRVFRRRFPRSAVAQEPNPPTREALDQPRVATSDPRTA
jgi:hypothetical protein